jgi:hypothetical protein
MNTSVCFLDYSCSIAFRTLITHRNPSKGHYLRLFALGNIQKPRKIHKNIYKRSLSGLIMEKDIGKIKKNDTTDIVIRVDDFGGRKGLTIREFVTSDRYTGFTKSGVRILSADLPAFREMINSVTSEDMAESEGGAEPKEKQKTFKPKAPAKKPSADDELPDY